jgi:hypothetical protein
VAPGQFYPYSIGPYRLGEVNDVFNGMDAVTSCRLATSLTCATRRWVVGSLSIVVTWLPRVVEPLRTVATHCERAAGLRCVGAVLQSVWPHVLLAFNTPPAACFAGARRRSRHVAP